MKETMSDEVQVVDNSKRELQDNVFYTPTEFARLRGCNIDTARTIFNLSDFPSENFGKEKVALGSAIREWYRFKRTREN